MAHYMLCYGSAYTHLKEPFRRLMEALGYESVTVFDDPEFGSVPDTALDRLDKCDAVVVLMGPSKRPNGGPLASDFAKWPEAEATIAIGQRKPLAIVLHEGSKLSDLFAADQTAAHFDFWTPQSFLENIHHIVKHLREFKRRVDNIEGERAQPFHYRKVVLRDRIQSDGSLLVQLNHEAVVQEPRSTFSHELDTGGDLTADAKLPAIPELGCQILVKAGNIPREASIEWGERTDHSIRYSVKVEPPLQSGEEINYTRRFRIPNNPFPLTRKDLVHRAQQPGFPPTFLPASYGDCLEVVEEIKELAIIFHFPPNVRIRNCRALVLHTADRAENKKETLACQPRIKSFQDDESMETTLELRVPSPLINHSYFLLYEPQD